MSRPAPLRFEPDPRRRRRQGWGALAVMAACGLWAAVVLDWLAGEVGWRAAVLWGVAGLALGAGLLQLAHLATHPGRRR